MRIVALVLLALTACAPKSAVRQIDALQAQVESLESEVVKLNQRLAAVESTRPSRPGTPGGGEANPQATARVQAFQREIADLQQDPTRMAELGERCKAFIRDHQTDINDPSASRLWRRTSRMCDEAAVVGMEAPAFDVERWYQGAAPGPTETTVLVFWESWCPHCRREMPKLQQLQDQMQGQVTFVGLTKVNRSATDETVQTFVADNNIQFPIGKERAGEMSRLFAVTGVPAAAVVRDGVVVWRGHPARLQGNNLAKVIAR